MKDDKKSSFLFNFYKKYKDRNQEPKEKPEEPTNTPPQEIDPEAAFQQELEKRMYLQPMLHAYSEFYPSNTNDMNVIDLENKVLSPILKDSLYELYKDEVSGFMKELSGQSQKLLSKITTTIDTGTTVEINTAEHGKEAAEASVPVLPPIDATLYTKCTKDKMCYMVFAFPPCHDGKDLGAQDIVTKLAEAGVSFGIDGSLINDIAQNQRYMKVYFIAKGIFPVAGKNGQIINKINYDAELEIRQDEKGTADFKNLNTVVSVVKDQVICDIIPPEDGVPGMDVYGNEIAAKNGKPAAVPNGKNTKITEDNSQLVSTLDGQLSYKNGHFMVEEVLIIKENVDYTVGNINFLGDVLVHGDVRNGFSIIAGGNVTVRGMVEGATITSGGDIIINKGMNGNKSGLLDAKGMVKTSFLENCTVYAGGSIHSNSIISCDIFCEDVVYAEGNKGVIIGGTITAYKAVEAKIVGSKSLRETNIILGEMPRLHTKKQELEAAVKESSLVLDKLGKNITYLNSLKAPLPPDKQALLNQLLEQQALYQEKKWNSEETLIELTSQSNDYSGCRLKSNMIFPPTKVKIGPFTTTITTTSSKCNVFLAKDGIEVGTL